MILSSSAGIIHSSGAGFVGVLDGISNVTTAYAMRRLLTSYAGPLVRLRRDSDDAESDFTPGADGELDAAAITTWLGGATPYIHTWYDQSGNSYDVTQTSTALQPQYAIHDGKPAYYGTGTQNLSRATTPSLTHPLTWISVAQATSTSSYRVLVCGNTNKPHAGFFTGGYQNYVDAGTGLMNGITSAKEIFTFLINGVSSEIWHNGTSQVSGNAGALTATGLVIGAWWDKGFSFYGYIHNLITIGASIPPSDHNTIGADMAARYGQSWTTVT